MVCKEELLIGPSHLRVLALGILELKSSHPRQEIGGFPPDKTSQHNTKHLNEIKGF